MPPTPTFAFGEPDRTSTDPGLFGPGSWSWRLHSDPSSGVGALRSYLLQALQPDAMHGVAKYSVYREDWWGRFFRTTEYVGVTTFGTAEEAERAAARVRDIHHRLGLDVPELLLWVHCGFIDSMLSTYRRTVGISPADADSYVREQLVAARLIGIPDGMTPSTSAELDTYFTDLLASGTLTCSDEAREAFRYVVLPPMTAGYRWLTPAQGAWGALATTSFALLPRWARAMYGEAFAGRTPVASVAGAALAGPPMLADFQATVAAKAWRAGLMALPEAVRKTPHILAAEERLGLAA